MTEGPGSASRLGRRFLEERLQGRPGAPAAAAAVAAAVAAAAVAAWRSAFHTATGFVVAVGTGRGLGRGRRCSAARRSRPAAARTSCRPAPGCSAGSAGLISPLISGP